MYLHTVLMLTLLGEDVRLGFDDPEVRQLILLA
jgi:hypothetical protein